MGCLNGAFDRCHSPSLIPPRAHHDHPRRCAGRKVKTGVVHLLQTQAAHVLGDTDDDTRGRVGIHFTGESAAVAPGTESDSPAYRVLSRPEPPGASFAHDHGAAVKVESIA